MPEPDNKVTPGQEGDAVAAYLAAARERWDAAGTGTWEDYQTALELLSSALRSVADVPRLAAAVETVLALAAEHEYGAIRWADPLPVPPWVGQVREAVAAGLRGTDPPRHDLSMPHDSRREGWRSCPPNCPYRLAMRALRVGESG